MITSVQKLLRLVGIGYEFKLELGRFLELVLTDPYIESYDETGNTPEIREGLYEAYLRTGPSMSFSTEEYAYKLLKLIAEVIVDDDDASTEEKAELNRLVLSAQRYVGIDEGDHESFHFMVEAYKLSAKIAELITGVTGGIVTLLLLTPGAGYTIDGTDNTETGVEVLFALQGEGAPAPSAEGLANISAGAITSITSITGSGDGYRVGDIVDITINTTIVGQEDATVVTRATARVTSVADVAEPPF